MVALPIRKEGLPDSIHPVDLSAMNYIENRGKPVQSWKDYYITVMGFPKDRCMDEAGPLTVSIGRVKGEKGKVLENGQKATVAYRRRCTALVSHVVVVVYSYMCMLQRIHMYVLTVLQLPIEATVEAHSIEEYKRLCV